jgi:cbb3-type cytochrome oxidase subunit 3
MLLDLNRAQGMAALVVSLSFFVIVIAFMLFALRNERKHQASNKEDHH